MLSKKYFGHLLDLKWGILSMLLLALVISSCKKELEVPDELEVSTVSPVVLADGGTLTLDVNSNTNWKVGKISDTWLQVSKSDGSGAGELVFSVDANDAVEARSTEFFIVTTKEGKYQKITLTQLASDPFITLEEEELEVGSRPRSHSIGLQTNIPGDAISVEIIYDEEEENWVSAVNVEAAEVKFQTALNTFPHERVATIIFSYTDHSGEGLEVWDKITITQLASGNDGPSELKDFDYIKGLSLGVIDENISIIGNIVSNGVSANFRAGTYIIQDENASAIAFESSDNLNFSKFEKVNLLLDGAQIETFEDGGVMYRVIKGVSAANIISREADPSFVAPVKRISELRDEYLLAYVTLKDVEFAMPHGGYANFHEFYIAQAYANQVTAHYPAPIRDIHGDDLYLITNKEVPYRQHSVPKGSGNIAGLVVKMTNSAYGALGDFSIRHLEEADIALSPSREDGFSKTLVEWEFPDLASFNSSLPAGNTAPGNPGAALLAPTTGLSTAKLSKHESTGLYAGYSASGGTYLVDKYRGDKPGDGTNTIIYKGGYNVNRWGTGKYWLIDGVSTLGITSSLFIQFEANSVAQSGPRDFAVETSLDGNTWTRIANYQVLGQFTPTAADQHAGAVPSYKLYTFKLPNELLDKPNIMIRLLNTSNVSVNGGNVNTTSATNRLGYFSIRYNK